MKSLNNALERGLHKLMSFSIVATIALMLGGTAMAQGMPRTVSEQPHSDVRYGVNRIPNAQLQQNIQNAIRSTARLKDLRANVIVQDGEVVLQGTAPDRQVRDWAERVAAWYTDRNVNNQIVVVRQTASY